MSSHRADLVIKYMCDCGCGLSETVDWESYLSSDLPALSFVVEFPGSDCGARRLEIDGLIKRTLRAFGSRDHRNLVGVSGPRNLREQ